MKDNQESAERIILESEQGDKIECEFGDRFEYEGDQYVLLVPYINGLRDDDGILLMQTVADETDPDVEYLLPLENPEDINTVFSAYIQHLACIQHADGTCFEKHNG